MNLTTGANAAFAATGADRFSLRDEPVRQRFCCRQHITTTTGTALNVANTTIGASGLIFRSISANGAANGIILNTTGSSGGLTVTGNGGSCSEATPTCTGGRIQNTTGADSSTTTPVGTGIVLNNTSIVSLTRMRIDNHSNYAIRGHSVNGFTMDSSLIDGTNGTNVGFSDGSLIFHGVTGSSSGMTGTCSITNSVIRGGWQRNVSIDNSVGTLNLTFTGNTVKRSSDAAGDDALSIEAEITANVTVNISNNTFARHGGDQVNLSLINNAVMNATIANNTMQGNYTGAPEGNHPIGLGQGIFILASTFNGALTYNINNNNIKGNAQGGAIHVTKGSGTGTFNGKIEDNTIGDPAIAFSGSSQASGILVAARGSSPGFHNTLVNSNDVYQYNDRGIIAEAGEGSAALNATITNNTISNFASAANSLHGIHADLGFLSTDTSSVCMDIQDNLVANAGNEPAGGSDIRLRKGSGISVRIPGLVGGTSTDARNKIAAENPNATTVSVTNPGGTNFTGGAACTQPSLALNVEEETNILVSNFVHNLSSFDRFYTSSPEMLSVFEPFIQYSDKKSETTSNEVITRTVTPAVESNEETETPQDTNYLAKASTFFADASNVIIELGGKFGNSISPTVTAQESESVKGQSSENTAKNNKQLRAAPQAGETICVDADTNNATCAGRGLDAAAGQDRDDHFPRCGRQYAGLGAGL
jgi:hypothetical protein